MSYPFIIFLLEKMPAKMAVVHAEKTFASFKPVFLYIDPDIQRELQEDLGLEIVTMSPMKSR